jgi:hypothetical protein
METNRCPNLERLPSNWGIEGLGLDEIGVRGKIKQGKKSVALPTELKAHTLSLVYPILEQRSPDSYSRCLQIFDYIKIRDFNLNHKK